MVEAWEINTVGLKVFIGYAILDPDGKEVDFFESYDDALAEFQSVTDDDEPSLGYKP